jgi:hypothetical protein
MSLVTALGGVPLSAKEAANRILALRELTRVSGTATTRTQNEILRSLSGNVLTEVALLLQKAVLSGEKEVR